MVLEGNWWRWRCWSGGVLFLVLYTAYQSAAQRADAELRLFLQASFVERNYMSAFPN